MKFTIKLLINILVFSSLPALFGGESFAPFLAHEWGTEKEISFSLNNDQRLNKGEAIGTSEFKLVVEESGTAKIYKRGPNDENIPIYDMKFCLTEEVAKSISRIKQERVTQFWGGEFRALNSEGSISLNDITIDYIDFSNNSINLMSQKNYGVLKAVVQGILADNPENNNARLIIGIGAGVAIVIGTAMLIGSIISYRGAKAAQRASELTFQLDSEGSFILSRPSARTVTFSMPNTIPTTPSVLTWKHVVAGLGGGFLITIGSVLGIAVSGVLPEKAMPDFFLAYPKMNTVLSIHGDTSSGSKNAEFNINKDGNLSLTSGEKTVWESQTSTNTNTQCNNFDEALVKSSTSKYNNYDEVSFFMNNQTLRKGEGIAAKNSSLMFTDNGELIHYIKGEDSDVISTNITTTLNPNNIPTDKVRVQYDGNIVGLDTSGNVIWNGTALGEAKENKYSIVLDNNTAIAIYKDKNFAGMISLGGKPVEQENTNI